MSEPATPVAAHRQRLRGQGLVRVEVTVRREDASLARAAAAALTDPARQAEARLKGIVLDRDTETGRDIAL